MIGTIKAELRKSRRPAVFVSAGLLAAVTVLFYLANWYVAKHPGATPRESVSLLTLYPDQLVSNIIGASFPIGAAIAIVLGAIFAGSEYGWGTLKTILTQHPGRLTVWAGRVIVFAFLTALLTVVLFAFAAAMSVLVASVEGHAITWPAFTDFAKGFGAIWLILTVNGTIGIALGTLIRQPAAALGIGLTYILAVEIIAVRFIHLINGGVYDWVTNNFVNQNATALAQSFHSAALAPAPAPVVSAAHAVAVLLAYGVALLIVSAGLVRLRDVT